jgi:hypothetical protein
MSEPIQDHFLGDLPIWSDEEARQILENICAKFNVPPDVIYDLVALQRERQHQERAAGVYERIEEIIGRMD